MKKLLLLPMIVMASFVNAQSLIVKEKLESIKYDWELNEEGKLTYTQVYDVENTTKNQLFIQLLSYFTRNYGDGDEVVQFSDKDAGVISGKAYYVVNVPVGVTTVPARCYHTINISIKDNKFRVVIELLKYYKRNSSGTLDRMVVNEFPINPRGKQKTYFGNIFYLSHKAAMATLKNLESEIKPASTDEDW